jgi:uncharacterized membrane protein
MSKKTQILTLILSVSMVMGGIIHFINPAMYNPFIPDFLPKIMVNYVAGVIEMGLGMGLLFPKYRKNAALGIFILMIAFLPLHTLDVFKENPAIGSKTLAYIRLPLQFLLIYWSFWVKNKVKEI